VLGYMYVVITCTTNSCILVSAVITLRPAKKAFIGCVDITMAVSLLLDRVEMQDSCI
jgi:hypothetical protein